jgi:hypothetical protein
MLFSGVAFAGEADVGYHKAKPVKASITEMPSFDYTPVIHFDAVLPDTLVDMVTIERPAVHGAAKLPKTFDAIKEKLYLWNCCIRQC